MIYNLKYRYVNLLNNKKKTNEFSRLFNIFKFQIKINSK